MLKTYLGGSLHINLEGSRLTLIQKPAWWQRSVGSIPPTLALPKDASQFDQHTWEHYFKQLLNSAKLLGGRCHITLADQWVRYFMVTPASNTRHLQDCKDVATARFQSLYDENMSHWIIQGDWHAENTFLACAMPQKIFAALKQVTSSHQLHILSLQPTAIALWNQRKSAVMEGDWLLYIGDQHILLAYTLKDKMHVLDTAWLMPEFCIEDGWLSRLCEQISFRLNIPIGKNLHVFGILPPAWHQGITMHIEVNTGWDESFPK
jgi:hypothetical protein